MPYYSTGEIKYYRFSSFENQGLYHAVFTRHGGFSSSPWKSLNFGASIGDDRDVVIRNRVAALSCINIKPESVFEVFQIHSTDIVRTDRPLFPNEDHSKADAIITNSPNVTLMMRFADCVPILLFDPVNRAIALIHAGWIGTVEKIVKYTVLAMVSNFKTDPSELIAAIGPSIGPDHYTVGFDVISRAQTTFGNKIDQVITEKNARSYFDLWKANCLLLMDAGVHKIEVSEICTGCNTDNWYSHRSEHGKTGRFGIVMGMY